MSIELKNFKSFLGHHLIGPILDLTAILGPNGSGKSNLIDAIAFALCLPLMPAKHSHLRDLLYRSPHGHLEAESEDTPKMFVQLNLSSGVSLRRAYFESRNCCEFIVVEQSGSLPLT